MKPASITVLKYSGILLICVLTLWWTIFYSPFNIPEYVPYIPVKVYGLFFSGMVLTILIFAQKELIRNNQQFNTSSLTLYGAFICFIMEIIFQVILSFTNSSDKLYYFIRGVATSLALFSTLSFFVAFQLKTKNTKRLLLFIVIFLALFKGLTIVFPQLQR